MKLRLSIASIILMATSLFMNAVEPTSSSDVKEITQAQFNTLVSKYEGGIKAWKYNGTRPAIIDFYAPWCGPCLKLSKIIKELKKEYAGKIDFYKINIDDNKEIATAYQISSIPMLLFAPVKGEPQVIVGLYPKNELVNAINYIFYHQSKK